MLSVTLGVLLISAFGFAQKDMMKLTEAALPDCLKEYPATEQELGVLFGQRIITDTKNVKCLVRCVLNKNGLMLGDTFSLDVMEALGKEVYPTEPAKVQAAMNLAKFCYPLGTAADGCDKTYEVVSCLFGNNAKFNFDILQFSPGKN